MHVLSRCLYSASLLKGWQLMAICTGAFNPSSEFAPYLMSYCYKHFEDTLVGSHAKFCLGQLVMGEGLKQRREMMLPAEINALMVLLAGCARCALFRAAAASCN